MLVAWATRYLRKRRNARGETANFPRNRRRSLRCHVTQFNSCWLAGATPTTPEGKVYELKEIGRRRKIVTKSWWNKEWLARLLGVVQALQTSAGRIEIGEGHRAVVMDAAPLRWECPVGLDVLALSGISDLGEEIANCRTRDDDEAEEAHAPATVERGASA